jgi:hypothetical protein
MEMRKRVVPGKNNGCSQRDSVQSKLLKAILYKDRRESLFQKTA